MDTLVDLFGKVSEVRYEEDLVDRVNYLFTAYIFVIASILIGGKSYMGSPITCWTPAEFQKSWNQYARDFCFIENTYYVPILDPEIPDVEQRDKTELPYYQWVQFVLVLLAAGFWLPHLFWRSVNWQSGLQVRAIISEAVKKLRGAADESKRDDTTSSIARHIHAASYRESRVIGGHSFVASMYITMKALFLLNIIVQLLILHLFLGFSFTDFLELKMGFNADWKSSGLFPRTTMCDFQVRDVGQIRNFSVQCVLTLNILNEKVREGRRKRLQIFVFLFYYLFILFLVTLVNTVFKFIYIFDEKKRASFAARLLKSRGIDERNPNGQESSKLTADRTNKYKEFIKLNPDLSLLLHLLSSNAGDLVTADITTKVYEQFCDSDS